MISSAVLAVVIASAALPRPEHPRPQFERAAWMNLNGEWTYQFDFGESGRDRGRELYKSKGFDAKITVPFCPESKLSGVGHTDFISAMWYHRKVSVPSGWAGKRIFLRFGAADWECETYVDGVSQGVHYGGTSSFSFDVTKALRDGREHELVVRIADHSRGRYSNGQPKGKQIYEYESNGCYYTRVTGIWQTVWLEAVAEGGLESCRIVPDLDSGSFFFTPRFVSRPEKGARVRATVKADGKSVATAEAPAVPGTAFFAQVRNVRAWSPDDPFLYDIDFEVVGADGRSVDAVKSYAGLRKIETRGNRLYLNDKPLYVRFVLDQGYYPDGVWTAPSDAALKKDIELSLAAGFNGARLHQKVFEERFHYWADRLGYLTWGESSSLGVDLEDRAAARNFLTEWEEIVRRDANHPSIIAWTPLNETGYSWPSDGTEFKRFHRDCYDVTKAIDPTRPVNEASGYIHVKTDLWTVHCYARPATLAAELGGGTNVHVEAWFRYKQAPYGGQPYINDEFGGLKWIPKGRGNYSDRTWGYGDDIKTEEDYYRILGEEVAIMASLTNMCGWCYTQLTDVEQEQNGVYNYDRTPKFDMKRIKDIFSGRATERNGR